MPNIVLLCLLPFGWIAFGLYYGIGQGKPLGFWLALVPAAISAGVAIHAWRKQQASR